MPPRLPPKESAKKETQHDLVYRSLLERIVHGQYPEDLKLPTQAELCREFNVSRAPVLHALGDLKKEGWLRIIQGAGAYVNARAKAGLNLGLIIPGIHHQEAGNLYFALRQQLIVESKRLGWHLLQTAGPSEQEAADTHPVELARRLIGQGLRAAVFLPHTTGSRTNAFNRNVLAEFDAAQVAVVLVDCDILEYPQRSSYDLVCLDHLHAGQIVGLRLVSAGCRRVVFLSPPTRASSVRTRMEGVRYAFASAGKESSLRGYFELDPHDLPALKNVLKTERPDGIICANDEVAAGMQRNLLSLGIKIPAEIKMASFDNIPLAALLPVPLTTAAQPVEALAFWAIETLRDRLERRDAPPLTVQVQSHLIERKSTERKG